MSILVTGGAGYIGSHMVLALLDAGEEPVVLDNLSTGYRWAVPPAVPLVVGDVGDADLVLRLISEHNVNAIIHFAGSIIVPESVVNPLRYYLNNTCNSRTLIACAVKAKVPHFIFSSTAAVYGMTEQDRINEDAELSPVSPYGNSKLMTETMLRDAAKAHEMSYIALRYFNVAGADPGGRSGQSTRDATHLIKVASEAAVGRRDYVVVFGSDYPTPDGTGVRDYIHVADLASAHLTALRHLRAGGECSVLNCGYGRGFSVMEVISSVQRIAGREFETRTGPRRPGDPAALVADVSRIRDMLDWQPKLDNLDIIVSHALNWERYLVEFRPTQ